MTNFKNSYTKYNELTEAFFKDKNLVDIKKQSQYFTPEDEVDKMLDDLVITEKDIITILDPSCGHGILVIKLLEYLIENGSSKKFVVYSYDTDRSVLSNFKSIFEDIDFSNYGISIKINYLNCDFLEANIEFEFDYIIMNPPYKKMRAAEVPSDLKHFLKGQPNLYHLFVAKALSLLDSNGTLCIISPKNYLSGRYTEYIRKYLFDYFSIYKIHTFNDRKSIFTHKITQEICIVHIRKCEHNDVMISYNGHERLVLPMETLRINNETNIVQTPRNNEDYKLIEQFKKFPIGTVGSSILMKTGKIVQFRVSNKDDVLVPKKYSSYSQGIPLVVYRHINGKSFSYGELTEKKQNNAVTLLDDGTNDIQLIENRNYLLIRKNTDKKYNKLIHAVSYLKELDSEKLAIDNGLAYFTNADDSLTKVEVLGLQCILMSKQFDDYYRMFNSSHALNIYEFQNMHFPDIDTIREIGSKLMSRKVTPKVSTDIFEYYLE